MIKEITINIGTATLADTESIISIWEEAKLTRSWNNPNDDIKNALTTPTSTILLLCDERQIVGTVMVGYDGHRGWIGSIANLNPQFFYQKKSNHQIKSEFKILIPNIFNNF